MPVYLKVWKKRSTFAEKTMEYTFKQAEAADMCQRIIPQDWRSEERWGGKVPSKAHRSCGTTPTEDDERQARYKQHVKQTTS